MYRSAALVAVLLAGAACGSASTVGDVTGAPDSKESPAAQATQDPEPADENNPDAPIESNAPDAQPGEETGGLADKVTPLPPAPTGLPVAVTEGPQPIGLTISSLDVETAGVINVGVEANGDMEIPPADKVGWYEFGATPGSSSGSSVLAAHIAYDGQDGVFVDLDEIELGSTIQVSYDDGSVVAFVATAVEQYDKDELPKESIFARTGEPQLVLITCGGDFNEADRSYDDNVVVYADMVGSISST